MSKSTKDSDEKKGDQRRRRSELLARRSMSSAEEELQDGNIDEFVTEYENYHAELEAESRCWQRMHEAKKKQLDEDARIAQEPITRDECRISFYYEDLLKCRPDYVKYMNRVAKCDSVASSYISYMNDGEKMLQDFHDLSGEVARRKKREFALAIIKNKRSINDILSDLAKVS